MKFKGNGIVWDADNDRVLCKFMGGELETEDVKTIKVLKDGGYAFEEEIKKKSTKSKGTD